MNESLEVPPGAVCFPDTIRMIRPNGECHDYRTFVQTVHAVSSPRQGIVTTLGKEPGLERHTRHREGDVTDLSEGRLPLGMTNPRAASPAVATA